MKSLLPFLSFFVGASVGVAEPLVSLSNDTLHADIEFFDCSILEQSDGSIIVQTGTEEEWPNISFLAGEEPWDLSDYSLVKVDITNLSSQASQIGVLMNNPKGKQQDTPQIQGFELFSPGETRTMSVPLRVRNWAFSEPLELHGMRRSPSQQLVDPAQVDRIQVFGRQRHGPLTFKIENIRAAGDVVEVDADTFVPFVDRYGQFKHGDWPTKIHNDDDLKTARAAEEKDWKKNPGPAGLSKFGGWANGPKLEATGFFRVEKVDGMWWFVDPEGYLFWSNGPTCVSPEFGYTGVSDRGEYFEDLPGADSPLAQFYGDSDWAPHGFYVDKLPYTQFKTYKANLHRKYGPEWEEAFAESVHSRLKSWGMNTVANWGSPKVYLKQKTPYVASIFVVGNRPLDGSRGYWGKFHDVFDPSFRKSIKRGLGGLSKEAKDPWCIGFFIDNELSWGDETSLALETLSCPPDQPAKLQFVQDLRIKYDKIRSLNLAWGSDYASWNALLESRESPDLIRAREDLRAFTAKTANTYFRTVKEELDQHAPDHLYLGCRFAWVNNLAAHASAIYCDVVSYNQYKHSIRDLHLPDFVDRPIIIGEYHFGATDWGHFHPGLIDAGSQKARGELYADYIRSGLENPQVVGAHWFQFVDEHIAGRGDGENYNVGLVDICDTPYPYMVQAIRNVADNMYEYRTNYPN
ncbi:MAG: beta-galactosidase [Verrucomicrobiota bacterium]